MKHLIKKYTLFLVGAYLLLWLLTGLFEAVKVAYPSFVLNEYSTFIINYFTNLLLVFLLLVDMKRIGVMWVPLLVLAFFSDVSAVPLFLLGVAFEKTNLKADGMNELIELLKKYVVILIVLGLLTYPILFVMTQFVDPSDSKMLSLLTNGSASGQYLLNVVIALLLYFDFKRLELDYYVWALIAALFYPLAGVVILALLYMQKRRLEQRI